MIDIKTFFYDNGLELSDLQVNQFQKYYELLIETNKVMNLTAITEWDYVIVKHFYDSVSLLQYVDVSRESSVLDLGTGAGFPGVPLKILRPDLQITLADSLNKRIKFLDTVIEELQLSSIQTIHARAEELARNANHREQYDYVVSRAVANLATLSEYCLPFVKVGGSFLPYKSAGAQDEIANAKFAVNLLGGKIVKTYEFELPMDAGERTIIQIDKVKNTTKKFPRKAGLPSKEPLSK